MVAFGPIPYFEATEEYHIDRTLFGNTPRVYSKNTLQLRHNGRDDVSNHQSYEYLLNRLFRRR